LLLAGWKRIEISALNEQDGPLPVEMRLNNPVFTQQDGKFMLLALDEAQHALTTGDYPVGAALAVNGQLIGRARNSILTEAQSTAHAEQKLLSAHSAHLRNLARAGNGDDICLYTTLEPCLMCLGVSLLHRVTRIVVACPDPHGGATGIDPGVLGVFYGDHWPKIESGLMRERSADLIIQFLHSGKFLSWETMLAEFTRMRDGW
jgi:tRNA(adenine34) deaminase